MNKLSPAKSKKYNTSHFLATGPSFSSLASSGSTIVLNRHYNFQDEEDGCKVLNSDPEFIVPLKDGENRQGDGDGDADANRDSGPNPSSGIGSMRRIPRTNSYYHRAGMTPRLDDMHFLANAPSFSSVATTATNVTDARLSSMASLANNSFVGRNGLSAAAMSMASTSSLHNNPRFALGRNASATSTASAAGPISSSARPLGTGNIFLQQDDADYQNILTSIATSNGIAMAPVAAADQIPESTAATTTALTDGPMDLRRTTSKPNSRRLSDEGTRLDTGSRKTSYTGGMRRSSSSAVSILRRGRYSSGYLSSVREYQDGDQSNTIHDNNHNESFNHSNNVKFTAPTIHLIGDDDNYEAPPHQQGQHHDEKEQTVDNAEDFDEDEQIPADILAAFAGDAIEGDSSVRRSSACSSLSFFPDDDDESLVDIVAELNDERGLKKSSGNDNKKPKPKDISKDDANGDKLSAKQHVPPEVTAVGRYYEDDELDEYLFTGIQSLHVDDGDKAGTTAASHKSASHTSNRHCQSAGESMSTLSTHESKRSVIS